jgi:biopolymer transport protein ExbB/TolQ
MDELFGNFRQLIFLDDPLGLLINVIILVLFALGCFDVMRALALVARERRWISQARQRLEDGECPKDKPSAALDYLGVPEHGLLGRRIARVMELRAAGVGQRNLLQQLTAERLEGYGALARYIGVTLTLLGLLGTVFGMSLALFKIQSALASVNDEASLQALVTALGETLGGMKTAFGCTLLGLMTAILMSFFNYRVRRRQSVVIHLLEEFILCDFLPALQKVDPDADDAAKTFAQIVANSADELEKSRANISASAKGFQDASAIAAQAANDMKLAIQSFGQQIGLVAGNQQTFTDTLQATQQALGKMTDAVTRQYEDVRVFMQSANQLLDQRLAVMEEHAKSNRALQENLEKLAGSFGPAVLGYHEQFKAAVGELFAGFKADLSKTLADVSGQHRDHILGQLGASQKAFDETLARHQTTLHSFADMVADARFTFGLPADNSNHDGHVAPRQAAAVAEGGHR